MTRRLSAVAREWWDYTTLEEELLIEASTLSMEEMQNMAREGFALHFYDTLEDFYLAEALEYISSWSQAEPGRPAGICGPIGPTEHLPLVARLVNELGIDLTHAHFWGMDEWVEDGRPVGPDHPLSFARADREMCFSRIRPELRMPQANIHFPTGDLAAFSASFDSARCVVMQGGQGEAKHWAFNDPVRREGPYADSPPSREEYRALGTRIVELHPLTIIQNARTSVGGDVSAVPKWAATVGPLETWKAARISIWQAGVHDGPAGMRLTALMISRRIVDTSVPMSLLADHPDVHFHYFRGGLFGAVPGMH